VAEDADLLSDLAALQPKRGPEKQTCIWWRDQPTEVHEATISAVQRVGHTGVARLLRNKGISVSPPDLKIHADRKCSKCQSSQTS
jgi:hypothetical protein